MMLKWNPKLSTNPLKNNQTNDADTHQNILPKYTQISDLGSHFGATCSIASFCDTFCFYDLFFGTSGGTPLDRFRPPLRHPWSDFLVLGVNVRSKSAPKFKDSRATNCTNHTFNKTGKDAKQNIPIINPN